MRFSSGQEMKAKPAAPLGECCLDDSAGVNGVVVEDEMKHPGPTIASQQGSQQVQEKPASFLVTLDDGCCNLNVRPAR